MPPQTSKRRQSNWLLGLFAGCLLTIICFGCLAVFGLAGAVIYLDRLAALSSPTVVVSAPEVAQELPTEAPPALIPVTQTPPPIPTVPAADPVVATPVPATPVPTISPTPTPTLSLELTPETRTALDVELPESLIGQPQTTQMTADLDRLLAADYPTHDFYESASRLGSFALGPRTVTGPAYSVGDTYSFYVGAGQIDAQLAYIGNHTYFWVEEGLNLDQTRLQQAAERFESEYYPQLLTFIGPEWSPGVDEDPHFSVLHTAGDMGGTDELGYFNSGDEYPRTFFTDSNEQEIVYLNMSNLSLGEDLYYGTLVHEFQHLAHWNIDGNENTWVDEGLSQLVELVVGLDTASGYDYLIAPETRLNSWAYDDDIYAHYGASYLFMVYLWEQLGDVAIQELARHPANGLSAVRSVLADFRPDLSLETLLADWAVANLIDNPAAGPQYSYDALNLNRAGRETNVRNLPYETLNSLEQFGVHYIELNTRGQTTITFAGDTLTDLVPVEPYSGDYMWVAPPVNSVNAQLTRAFDLSELSQATLEFQVWYDLEDDFDFAYVSISHDDGQTWRLLSSNETRPGDYGPAYTGNSGAGSDGWLPVRISLNSEVGGEVLIRFEMLTDTAILGGGMALDDITIPELGYQNGAETAESGDGWDAQGFVPTGRWLPQQWAVRLVEPGLTPNVITLELDEQNQGQWPLELGNQGAILVITPLTPFANNAANYWLEIE
jgi:hypothetical protein